MKLIAILIQVQGCDHNGGDWVKEKANISMNVVKRHDRIRTQLVYIILRMM